MNSTNLDYIYAKLMGPIMNTLLIEMLVLGVFFVLYSYVRVIIKEPKVLTSRGFMVRLVLLVDIVLFNIFIAVSYFLDYSNVSLEELISFAKQLSAPEYFRAKLTFFLMVPLDMATIVISVSMYAVISISDEFKIGDDEFTRNDIRQTITNLLFVGVLFHSVSILWWLTLGGLTRSGFLLEDIGFHFLYVLIYSAGYFTAKKSKPKNLTDLLLIGYYSMAMLSIYVFRTMTFMDRLFGH